MDYINFVCGGKTGDLIHSMLLAKNICNFYKKSGIFYLSNNKKYGGFKFSYEIRKTLNDLKDLFKDQDYINDILLLKEDYIKDKEYINLNILKTSSLFKKDNWTNIIQDRFNLGRIDCSPWLKFEYDASLKDKILIHRSIHRHSKIFPWEYIVNNNKCAFICCGNKEYKLFPYKDQVEVININNLRDIGIAINSCKFFIGNLSTPSAIAHGLCKPRLFELEDKYYNHFVKEEIFFNNYSYIGDNVSFLDKNIFNFINLKFNNTSIRTNPPKNKY